MEFGPDTSSEEIAAAVDALSTPAGWHQYFAPLEQAARFFVPQILNGAVHANASVRMWCVDLLSKVEDARSDAAVLNALRDSVADVRRHAVLAAAQLARRLPVANADALPALADRVERDRSLLVRRLAAHVLGDLPVDARIVPALRRVMGREKDAKLRTAVWRALGRHEMATSPTSSSPT